jgi:5-methylcytosine-specific restriction endonuclease McrA
LVEYVDNTCENCRKRFKLHELEIHRIRPGDVGGTYEFKNCMVLCKECHKIFTSAQSIARGISK